MDFNSNDHPHRRFNALTGEWSLVSPHRAKRPWQGQVEKNTPDLRPEYDPDCYLCPDNIRSSGKQNPPYKHTFTFTNDFAAIIPDVPSAKTDDGFLKMESLKGTCRVICFSPRHDLSLPELPISEIVRVVKIWSDQTAELGQKYQWVQIFENKGAIMGSSMPHPHGQVWAMDALPNEPKKEDQNQKEYYRDQGESLLVAYLDHELKNGQRVVLENDCWAAVVPFWAVWPFEILLLPKRHVLRLPDLTDHENKSLAKILKKMLTKYDNLFETSFPYSMGWHGAPYTDIGDTELAHWQLHAHFFPPLLRSATVKKFMVGFEMLAEPQRDLTAEQAASRLREISNRHYKEVQE